MPSNTVLRGNILLSMLLGPTLTPAVVPPNTTSEQTFTVPGLQVGDFINIAKPTVQAGLGIINSRVSAVNTLAIGFSNNTAATITPTAGEIYQVSLDRPENLPLPANAT